MKTEVILNRIDCCLFFYLTFYRLIVCDTGVPWFDVQQHCEYVYALRKFAVTPFACITDMRSPRKTETGSRVVIFSAQAESDGGRGGVQ